MVTPVDKTVYINGELIGRRSPYVYGLIDSRTGKVFYIGKGVNRRVFSHVLDAKRGKPGVRFDLIREIISSGADVKHKIFGVFQSESDALEEEKRLIAATSGLVNVVPGGGGAKLGGVKQYMMLRARRSLLRMKTFEEWVVTMPSCISAAISSAGASALDVYNYFYNGLVKQSIDPDPVGVEVLEDGSIKLLWE